MKVKILLILLTFYLFNCISAADGQVLTEDQLRKLLSNFDDSQLEEILHEIMSQYEHEKLRNLSSSSGKTSVQEVIEKINTYPDLYVTTNLGKIFKNLFEVLRPKVSNENSH